MRKKTQMWRDHIRKQEQSGLSASAYCRKAKIKLSSFRYHKSLLLKISRNPHHESPAFLPIVVDSHPPKPKMRLAFAGGVKLEFDEDVSPQRLVALVDRLKRSA